MNENFTIQIRSIDTIRPYEKNHRINDSAADAVAASLKAFGFRQPILVDGDGIKTYKHIRQQNTPCSFQIPSCYLLRVIRLITPFKLGLYGKVIYSRPNHLSRYATGHERAFHPDPPMDWCP